MLCFAMAPHRFSRITIVLLFAAVVVVVARAQAPAVDADAKPDSAREQKVKKLLDYLEEEYAKKTAAPYWVSRAMGTVTLARIPRPTATANLFAILEQHN